MLNRKALVIAVSVSVAALTLSACDNGDNGAKDAAQKLASGLSSLNVNALSFTGAKDGSEVNDKVAAMVKALASVQPKVSFLSVDPAKDSKDQVTAKLNYDWGFNGGTWTYSTTASLSRKDSTWTTAWSPQMVIPGFKDGDSLHLRSSAPARGQILGDGGEVLVEDRPVLRIGIDKTKADAGVIDASARALAALVQVDLDAYAKQVAAAGPQAFVEALSLRDDASRTVTDQQIGAIAGAVAIKDKLPLAPTRGFARPILGTVGEATAELIDKSNGRIKSGDHTGLSGLQAQYDKQLAGTPGIQVVEKDPKAAASDQPRVLFDTQSKPGANLTTTLSSKVQNLAEGLLADPANQASVSASSIVAIKPSTGAILAAASGPGSNGYDTAMLGQYAPGSTFKTITSLAMLRKGQTPDSVVPCTPTLEAGGTTFKNAPTYNAAKLGNVPLRTAFSYSCNTAFISQAGAVSQAELASAAASLGIGVPTDVGASSYDGSVPLDGTPAEHAASMIGQGKVQVSPVGMANIAASVAAGALVKPKLVITNPTPSGSAAPSSPSSPASRASNSAAATPPVALTAGETGSLKELMAGVVSERNAGPLLNLPGGQVFAKTGTAEFGTDTPPKTHSWLIAIQGDFAAAMFIEDGGYASVVLGPLMAKFLNGIGG